MNLLKPIYLSEVQLKARNEGKIKSYDSCIDLRAWSHDIRKRDRYLREWIKADMPQSVIPVNTLLRFFHTMTCKTKGRVTPRCHPNCKSKEILDCITASCEAIRECLKEDECFEKFMCEEELETSHWPYEKCLDALKNIKLFWRILLEKVFAINLKKDEHVLRKPFKDCDNIRELARSWAQELIYQAKFVKKLGRDFLCGDDKVKSDMKTDSCDDLVENRENRSDLSSKKSVSIIASTETETDLTSSSRSFNGKICETCGKQIVEEDVINVEKDFVNVEKHVVNVEKDDVNVEKDVVYVETSCGGGDDIPLKSSQENIRKDYELQKAEIIRLEKEIKYLRCELQDFCLKRRQTPVYCTSLAGLSCRHNNANDSQTIESYCEVAGSTRSSSKSVDSELIITMKNCKHESYAHVSLLQVLHKTNGPYLLESCEGPALKSNEDPIKLLTKVQATIEKMVRREIDLAKQKKIRGSDSEINAFFQHVNVCRASMSELAFPVSKI